MKKVVREMQTLCAGCSKAEPKILTPPQTPLPGAWYGQNLISWRWSLPSPTDPVWWGSMHAISSYRGNRPTHTVTNPQTGLITIHCAAKLSAQCNNCHVLVTNQPPLVTWYFNTVEIVNDDDFFPSRCTTNPWWWRCW